jgi:hypothetical protein
MPRYRRQADTRWVYAAGVAGAYAVAVATLFTLQVGAAVILPVAVVALTPVLVYAALSLVLVRDAPIVHRMSWIGAACLTHALLGVLASAELMWVAGLPAPAALAQVFRRFAPAPVLTLLATPLVLALLGAGALRPGARVEPPLPRRSTAPAASRSRSFARRAPPRLIEADPALAAAPSVFAPAAGPTLARSAPPRAFRLPAPADVPIVAVAAPPVAPAAAMTEPLRPSASPGEAVEPAAEVLVAHQVVEPAAEVLVAHQVVEPAAEVLVAHQVVEPAAEVLVAHEVVEPPAPSPAPLEVPPTPRRSPPAEASTLSVDDGLVRISFDRVAAQLPAEAFVLPVHRLGESLKEPHTLLVPRRVVLAQMRAGGIAVDWQTIAAQFPELALGMSAADFRHQYPDLTLSLPVDEVLAQLPPDTMALASAVLSADGSTVSSRAEPPASPGPPPAEWSRIIEAFSGAGVFQAAFEPAAGRPLVSLVEPGLERSAVAACAGALVRIVDGHGEVITARTARAVVVLAVGPIGVLAAARRPGVPAALLELRAVRAAAAGDARAVAAPPSPRRPLEPRRVAAGMASAARALASFGAVRPAVFADRSARVYVFSADERAAAALGERALTVCAALNDAWELGPLVSVTFRRGGELTLVRPLAGGGALAATGPVTRPGRAHRDADRAAAVLEML